METDISGNPLAENQKIVEAGQPNAPEHGFIEETVPVSDFMVEEWIKDERKRIKRFQEFNQLSIGQVRAAKRLEELIDLMDSDDVKVKTMLEKFRRELKLHKRDDFKWFFEPQDKCFKGRKPNVGKAKVVENT